VRSLVAVALVLTLAGCAPDAGGAPDDGMQRVEVEGTITEFMAMTEGSDGGYLLDVAGHGYLSIAIEGRPPASARGVVVEVPSSAEIPDDVTGEFAALMALVDESGEPLPVVDYLG
jgi:hypothetical protein